MPQKHGNLLEKITTAKKKNLRFILLFTITLSATFAMLPSPVQAAITLAAPIITDPALIPGSMPFRINITVADVQKMGGYQFVLSYNTSILTALNAGSYPPFNTHVASEINNTAGYVALAYWTYFGDPNGFSTPDPTPIAWIEFSVDDYGSSTLDFSNTGLSDVFGNPLSHTSVDGHFTNVWHPDNAVTNVTVFPTTVSKGETVNINVTVENQHTHPSTFDVTIYYNDTPIETEPFTDLENGTSKTVQFTWNTTYITPNTYTIKAQAEILQGESDLADNTFVDGTVTIVRPAEKPIANFTYSPAQPLENHIVIFDASLSTANGGTIISYTWDFGDGVQESYIDTNLTNTAAHNYTKTGQYIVTLKIMDSEGRSDAVQAIVTVYRRDIAIVNVTLDKTEVKAGELLKINVTVTNRGNFTETFDLVIYRNDTEIQMKTVNNLAPGKNETLTYSWNTTSVPQGNYVISAEAIVAEDADQNNNKKVGGTITLVMEEETQEPVSLYYYILVTVAIGTIIAAAIGIYVKLRKKETK